MSLTIRQAYLSIPCWQLKELLSIKPISNLRWFAVLCALFRGVLCASIIIYILALLINSQIIHRQIPLFEFTGERIWTILFCFTVLSIVYNKFVENIYRLYAYTFTKPTRVHVTSFGRVGRSQKFEFFFDTGKNVYDIPETRQFSYSYWQPIKRNPTAHLKQQFILYDTRIHIVPHIMTAHGVNKYCLLKHRQQALLTMLDALPRA